MPITRAGISFGHHQRSSRLALAALAGFAWGGCAVNQAAFAQPGGPSIPLTATAQASGAVITRSAGIDFVTIGSAGNAGWPGLGTPGPVVGRGAVGYEYRIGRFEVTTSQWVEFYNAAFDRPIADRLPHLIPSSHWGAVGATPNTPGGRRWSVPVGNEMRPVGNISWRMAAMYTNWLHNDKSTDRAAFLNGAYDVSTFGYLGQSSIFTDQLTHNPGARFWIPTWDESLKAAHFDPNKSGPGQTGWWTYPTTSDVIPAYGPPGEHVRLGGTPQFDPNGPLAQANGGWSDLNFPGFSAFGVNLGAYPTVQSPWGLLDTAGGTIEWSEEALFSDEINQSAPLARIFEGSGWASPSSPLGDQLRLFGGDFPSLSSYEFGFRIATAVPSPAASAPMLVAAFVLSLRRKRNGGPHAKIDRLAPDVDGASSVAASGKCCWAV